MQYAQNALHLGSPNTQHSQKSAQLNFWIHKVRHVFSLRMKNSYHQCMILNIYSVLKALIKIKKKKIIHQLLIMSVGTWWESVPIVCLFLLYSCISHWFSLMLYISINQSEHRNIWTECEDGYPKPQWSTKSGMKYSKIYRSLILNEHKMYFLCP